MIRPFAFELAAIVQDGIRRMYQDQEEIFYYITVHNEPYAMPAMPEDSFDGIVRGIYRFSKTDQDKPRKAHLFGSGAIMTQVLRAAELLQQFDVAADIWSVTSYNELCREAPGR